MKKTLLLLFFFYATSIVAQDEKTLIKESFNNYKEAILNEQGEVAVQFVDANTIQYYSEMLETVKVGDSTTLRELPLLDKLMVFSIKHRTSREDILSFDGKKLFVYAIEKGMIGKGSVMNISIGDVTMIDATKATGVFVTAGQPTPISFDFHKEEEIWKVDLTSIFEISEKAFAGMIKEQAREENEFLLSLLEMMTQKKPTNAIWHPMQ